MWRLRLLPPCLRLLSFACVAPILAAPTTTSSTSTAPNPTSTICGDIATAVFEDGQSIFLASEVHQCLLTVPFNAAVATRFVAYWKDALQFQSTLAYLRNPPPSYQQPAVDLLGGLALIQQHVDNGGYTNEYDFETDLQRLLYAANDDHLTLVGGILGAFTYGAPVSIVSVSRDGQELPKTYLFDDLYGAQRDPSYTPSAISKINGMTANQYLGQFAARNALGALESHAELNLLMASPAGDIQDFYTTWSGDANFYPGDTLSITLENGTQVPDLSWLAVYNGPEETGPLQTGGDFYNFFVLGLYPASFDPYSDDISDDESTETSDSDATPTDSEDPPAPTPSGWGNPAYPEVADVSQLDLGTFGGGFVSGYFLEQSSVAVLSIPSFKASGEAVKSFSSTVREFLVKSKAAGMKKVVVDLQQNYGGDTLLAYEVFKNFFPTIDPYGGSRLRAHPLADSVGDAISGYFDTPLTLSDPDYYALYTNDWVASTRLNSATNRHFASWDEAFGPHLSNGDSFTAVQRLNLSDTLFNTLFVGDPNDIFTVYGYGARPANTSQPYAAEDIIILSDGLCSSTCSIFMEMMHHEAGVRTVVAGGVPAYGPMQAPSLTRGARLYGVDDTLDANINYAQAIAEFFDRPSTLPNRTEALSFSMTSSGINLRDQVRQDDDVPIQFKYEAADCRIFFTPKTFYNYTALWQYAADAIWKKPSLCVNGSTGYSSVNVTKTAAPPQTVLVPAQPVKPPELGAVIMSMIAGAPLVEEPALSSGRSNKDKNFDGTPCRKRKDRETNKIKLTCPKDFFCLESFKVCDGAKQKTVPSCVALCPTNNDEECASNFCQPFRQSKAEKLRGLVQKRGYCEQKKNFCSSGLSSKSSRPGKPSTPFRKG
ncbi:hypothetical protein BJ875DRAFT_456406 [Amylocarpus encephaloides]|uniref:CPAF-like PDZ domain-containing protein n=1 Tax=Amylocarpus encephaloides TaxID=45428 RepID=A0A9P7YNR2_9HELO|nr:hypothetical protein BJ875DRAFT_456406 [Amylocarpus encephaloides]